MGKRPPTTAPNEVAQAELARLLGVTTRQIRNLEEAGLPHRAEGNGKRYPIPEAVLWYAEYKFAKPPELDPWKNAELRKKLADAQLAEYELAILRRDYVAMKDVVAMLREPLDRVNAGLLSAPTKWAARFVGLTTIPEALKLWQQAIDEIRAELRAQADVPFGDEQDDRAGAAP